MFLHHDIIYGPVRSRRLGLSLGINLLPVNKKVCNFNCIYCECGWTDDLASGSFSEIFKFTEALENALKHLNEKKLFPDHITFSGNGEPTLYPAFADAVEQSIRLRNQWTPNSRIAVLTNGTTLRDTKIFKSLMQADQRIIKLDAGSEQYFRLINIPQSQLNLQSIVQSILAFEGQCVIQSLFLRGEYKGVMIDNTRIDEVKIWFEHIKRIHPRLVMIYSLDRVPPAVNIHSIPESELELIAEQVRAMSIDCRVF